MKKYQLDKAYWKILKKDKNDALKNNTVKPAKCKTTDGYTKAVLGYGWSFMMVKFNAEEKEGRNGAYYITLNSLGHIATR